MIDSHAHIIDEFYSDIDLLTDRIKNEKVIAVINTADSIKTSKEVLFLFKKYDKFLFPTAGIHPQNIDGYNKIEDLENLIKNNKFYAVGEIGLDYNYNEENSEEQKDYFIKQIDIANKYNLPIVVHTRDAMQDTFDILKSHKCRGVIHCYSGSVEMAREFVKLGFYLGIGGVLTFKNSKLFEVVREIDINNLLLETDSPFLSPEPFRGKQNIPSNISYVAKMIAEIKKTPYEKVIEITTQNAIKVFDLDI